MPTQQVQERNSEMVSLLSADFQPRYDAAFAWSRTLSALLNMPALRGLWGMSAVGASGEALDLGPLGLDLTRNGTLEYDYDGLFNYAVLNGLTDYLSKTSEPAFNITGTESYIANPGLTVGGWFWFDTTGSAEWMISKYLTTGDERSYGLLRNDSGNPSVIVSSDGTVAGITQLTAMESADEDTWYFIAARLIPSTEMKIWLNDTASSLLAGIPASIYASAADFNIGARSGGIAPLAGRAGPGFMCAAAASDAQIMSVYEATRPMVGR